MFHESYLAAKFFSVQCYLDSVGNNHPFALSRIFLCLSDVVRILAVHFAQAYSFFNLTNVRSSTPSDTLSLPCSLWVRNEEIMTPLSSQILLVLLPSLYTRPLSRYSHALNGPFPHIASHHTMGGRNSKFGLRVSTVDRYGSQRLPGCAVDQWYGCPYWHFIALWYWL